MRQKIIASKVYVDRTTKKFTDLSLDCRIFLTKQFISL